jgi:hypothetical protein
MILMDHPAIRRTRSGTHLHGSIQTTHRIGLPVVRVDKLPLVGIQLWPNGRWRNGMLLAGRASAQRERKQRKFDKSDSDETACQSFLLTCRKTKKLSGRPGQVNLEANAKC